MHPCVDEALRWLRASGEGRWVATQPSPDAAAIVDESTGDVLLSARDAPSPSFAATMVALHNVVPSLVREIEALERELAALRASEARRIHLAKAEAMAEAADLCGRIALDVETIALTGPEECGAELLEQLAQRMTTAEECAALCEIQRARYEVLAETAGDEP